VSPRKETAPAPPPTPAERRAPLAARLMAERIQASARQAAQHQATLDPRQRVDLDPKGDAPCA